MKKIIFPIIALASCSLFAADKSIKDFKIINEASEKPVIKEKIVIDKVWAGHPVAFFLGTKGPRQYVAYYNKDRRMIVGVRKLGEKKFKLFQMPSKLNRPPNYKRNESSTILGWDSHNYITLKEDKDGYVHLAGNMHCNGLTYFRTAKPYDITSFKQVDSMVGKNEDKCTYPKFMDGPNGALIFHYRDGSSGNGNEIYNIYDSKNKTWKRLLDKPLADGKGLMNAYLNGPVKGPDGNYHVSWVWRDTYDCKTNHDLSYAVSKDLVNWQAAGNKNIKLPMTIDTKVVVVDPIPVDGGIINGTGKIGFDVNGKPVLTYHKFDKDGNTQIYAARFENGKWKIRQLTHWKYRWYFSGGGSISVEVKVGTVKPRKDGRLELYFYHKKFGSGTWLLDNDDFAIVGRVLKPKQFPRALVKVESKFPGIGVRWGLDAGKPEEQKVKYLLRWETLGRNRDRPRTGPVPEPQDLILYKIKYQ